jgi:multiple sugar transport system permease protein
MPESKRFSVWVRKRFSVRVNTPPEENTSGFGTAVGGRNPAMSGVLHLILCAAASLFILPLVWMAVTAVKPLNQTMQVPPTWIPRATYATIDGQKVIVEPKLKLEHDSVLVIQHGGHDKGQRKLIAADSVKDGKSLMKFTQAGREVFEDEPVPVEILKKCPAGLWRVEEWVPEFSAERERAMVERKWDCVSETEMSAVPHAFWSNYNSAIERMHEKDDPPGFFASGFPRNVLNTMWICLLSVTGVVVSSTLVAYAFAFFEFPGRNFLFAVTLAVMMVPFPAVMVPLFDELRKFGWVGSTKPLWVPAWFGSAFFVFLLRQFFLGLPRDLLDAARIDGCSELEILWHVVVPLARPALAMIALMQFLGSWKDFMGPLLYLSSREQFTLSVALQSLLSQQGGTPWHIVMAASMLFSMPLIVLFIIARKSFMKGIAMTGIKG